VDPVQEPFDIGPAQRRRVLTAARTGRQDRGEHGDRADPVAQGLLTDPADGGRSPPLGTLAQPALGDGCEVQPPRGARCSEQAQVPHVAVPLGLGVGVGQADPVDTEAGEPRMVSVSETVQGARVELADRANAAGSQLVDPRPHPAGHDADLIGCPASDRVEQLDADQCGQAPQAEHPAVRGLAHPCRPGRERVTGGAALASPGLIVDLAQPALTMSGTEVAAGCAAGPEVGQRPCRRQERLQTDAARPSALEAVGMGMAQPPRPLGRARARSSLGPGDSAALVGAPPALNGVGLSAGHPALDVRAGRGFELPTVQMTEHARSVHVPGAARHRAGQDSGQPPARAGQDQFSLSVPLPAQPVRAHQRGQPLDPPVPQGCWPLDGDPGAGPALVHRVPRDALPCPSTAARMSCRRACR